MARTLDGTSADVLGTVLADGVATDSALTTAGAGVDAGDAELLAGLRAFDAFEELAATPEAAMTQPARIVDDATAGGNAVGDVLSEAESVEFDGIAADGGGTVKFSAPSAMEDDDDEDFLDDDYDDEEELDDDPDFLDDEDEDDDLDEDDDDDDDDL